jgi:hypothetical protein
MITPAQVQAIAALVQQKGLDSLLITELRQRYPDLSFTYCMDDEMGGAPTPILESAGCNFYLVDTRAHCLSLTRDYDVAGGLVLAAVEAD